MTATPRGRALLAVVVTGLALVLLTATGSSHALWANTAQIGGVTIQTGRLQLSGQRTAIVLERPGQPARDVTSTLATEKLVVGDTVRVTTSVDVVAVGDNLSATLALDTTALAASSKDLSVQVDTSRVTLAPVAGATGTWQVGPEHNGSTQTAIITLHVPAEAPDGAWWGAELQGAVLAPGALTWRLTQEGGGQ